MNAIYLLIFVAAGAQVELNEYSSMTACLEAARDDGRPTVCRVRVQEEEYAAAAYSRALAE